MQFPKWTQSQFGFHSQIENSELGSISASRLYNILNILKFAIKTSLTSKYWQTSKTAGCFAGLSRWYNVLQPARWREFSVQTQTWMLQPLLCISLYVSFDVFRPFHQTIDTICHAKLQRCTWGVIFSRPGNQQWQYNGIASWLVLKGDPMHS